MITISSTSCMAFLLHFETSSFKFCSWNQATSKKITNVGIQADMHVLYSREALMIIHIIAFDGRFKGIKHIFDKKYAGFWNQSVFYEKTQQGNS